ncbi:MAG TPA: lysylphosphatidylglycerol synthase domain-containing protein [Rhizomicrobium sp.]
MKPGVVIAALAGVGLGAYLVFYLGVGAIFVAAARVGWWGFCLICVLGLLLFAVLGIAWSALVPRQSLSGLATFIWGRAVRDSASEVLPFSHVGGIVIGARAVILRGVGAPMAFASTIADVTTEMTAQVVYVLVGIAILVARAPKSVSAEWLANTATAAAFIGALFAVAFLMIQKRGFAFAEKIAARILPGNNALAGVFQNAMESIHAAPWRVVLSVILHLGGWFAGALVTFVMAHLMGIRVAFVSILSIEALLCAIRSAAIIVPNALGVQEAAYAMLMPFFGIAATSGVALSLLKRARDITIGIPILLVWQAAEGRFAFGKDGKAALSIKEKRLP